VADLPLRTATDLRLGRPLPHQLANLTQAHPIAAEAFPPQGLCGISTSFPVLSPTIGQIPTRYSPVRHSSAPSKLGLLPFDLHVLSMPPAFNLSQDQTLQFNLSFLLPHKGATNFTSQNRRYAPTQMYVITFSFLKSGVLRLWGHYIRPRTGVKGFLQIFSLL
jgi:hypothetical protein